MTAKKTCPTRHLYAGHAYTPSDRSDIRELFKRLAEEKRPAQNVSPLKAKRK